MDDKEKLEKVQDLLKDQDLFTALSIERVNHKPHPFCIGPEHIERYALNTQKGCAMYVDSTGRYTNGYKKGFHKCGLPLAAHTSECVCFLQLNRHAKKAEAQYILQDLVERLGDSGIDGYAFVETPEKYRIGD